MGQVPGHLAATILRSSVDDWPRIQEKRCWGCSFGGVNEASRGAAASSFRLSEFRQFSVELGKNFRPEQRIDQMKTTPTNE